MKRILWIASLLLSLLPALPAQLRSPDSVPTTGSLSAPSLALDAGPIASFAVGNRAGAYRLAYGGQLTALMSFPSLPFLAPRLDLGYLYIPVELDSTVLSVVGGHAGVELSVPLGERVRKGLHLLGGGYYGWVSGETEASAGYLGFDAGGGVTLQLFNDLAVRIGASYRTNLGLYDGVTVGLFGRYRVAGSGGGSVPLRVIRRLSGDDGPRSGYVDFSGVNVEPVFPVLWKYYDTNPVGTATITNRGAEAITAIDVRLAPASYIDEPKVSARIDRLEPGESATVDLFVLFNDSILGVSEGTKIASTVETTYQVSGSQGTDATTVTIDSFDRNALRWDDDAKIAAFVTARDEEIRRFSRPLVRIADETDASAISRELGLGIAALAAMAEERLQYIIDPASAYESLSQDPVAIDFVQFPVQTLSLGGGDCDDLSSTYNALLESLGVRTAFVTTPGHIFAAFRLEMDATAARDVFSSTDDLIVREDGSIWVPVETTLLSEGFVQAWQDGARQWRAADQDGTAGFFTTVSAWERFQPVAFSVSDIRLERLDDERVSARYGTEVTRFTERELAPREQPLLQRLERNSLDQRALNRLGVLYARFGRFAQARSRFEEAQTVSAYVPSILNLGNLALLQGNPASALEAFAAGLEAEPSNPAGLLGKARSQFELGEAAAARETFLELQRVSPAVAERYSFLGADDGGPGRASAAQAYPSDLFWSEGGE